MASMANRLAVAAGHFRGRPSLQIGIGIMVHDPAFVGLTTQFKPDALVEIDIGIPRMGVVANGDRATRNASMKLIPFGDSSKLPLTFDVPSAA